MLTKAEAIERLEQELLVEVERTLNLPSDQRGYRYVQGIALALIALRNV